MMALMLLATAIGSWIPISGGTWQPGPQDVSAAQTGLQRYVAKTAKIQQIEPQPWSSYTFQYQGTTIDNRRMVFINAFCIEPPDYSTDRLVVVLDGGPCFFSLLYDPKTKTYSKLLFNSRG